MMRAVARLAVVVLGLASSAQAQPHRAGGRPAGPSAEERPERPERRDRRERIKKQIRALRAYTLTEELALDDQTAGKLFPVLARYDDETDRLLEKRVDLQRQLRRAGSLRDARAIDRLLDDAVANQRGFWNVEDRRFTELRKLLTPAQAAKLLVVLPAFERRVQKRLLRVTRQERPGIGGDRGDGLEPDEFEFAPTPTPTPAAPRQRRLRLGPRAPRALRGGPARELHGPNAHRALHTPEDRAWDDSGAALPCAANAEPCR